tara:strand:- start:382 stop:1230 length:849 start_codon:yes stop_codon:yes gene_type:complete
MILYIQTPATPRSDLHDKCIRLMMKELDNLDRFTQIRWFINIDVIEGKAGNHKWEDYRNTEENFYDILKELNKTEMFVNISNEPCFYLAFRTLFKGVRNDIISQRLSQDNYCVMWLEDDWEFTDLDMFKDKLNEFLDNDIYQVLTLNGADGIPSTEHKGKINMGGNPDIIRGEVFEMFDDLDWDKKNKRDPEFIRKEEVFFKNIWEDPYPNMSVSSNQKLKRVNESQDEVAYGLNYKVLTSNCVDGVIGDVWRERLRIQKSWDYSEKSGILEDESYTYKKGE